jgi:ankyrin repeat protein
LQDAENRSAVELAARSGHVDIVVKILDCSCKHSEKKMSALHLATLSNLEHLVELLLHLPGISADIADLDGLTPLHWAASKGWPIFSTLKKLISKSSLFLSCSVR